MISIFFTVFFLHLRKMHCSKGIAGRPVTWRLTEGRPASINNSDSLKSKHLLKTFHRNAGRSLLQWCLTFKFGEATTSNDNSLHCLESLLEFLNYFLLLPFFSFLPSAYQFLYKCYLFVLIWEQKVKSYHGLCMVRKKLTTQSMCISMDLLHRALSLMLNYSPAQCLRFCPALQHVLRPPPLMDHSSH